ncbi:hypothetical protein [Paraglaciecola sp.]|uniref:hypothetical protein n=1 Tax=Paraglaciecola sp. TaxID=1920173 RepID=UPI00326730B6
MLVIKRVLGLFFITMPLSVNAWEAYTFQVSNIRVVGEQCKIGMSNLSVKKSEDSNICDDPEEIRITDCTTDKAKYMMSMAMSAKVTAKTMYHQATSEYSTESDSYIVNAYQLGLEPD